MRFPVMGFRAMRLRVMRLRALVTANFGKPTAESQRAGLDHLMWIAAEQAAAEQAAARRERDTCHIPAQ
jgi:hypothetical protein